mmetsp:Transcript_10544/g.20471  ORF Transcript_10544/g.20471 Transcript_10544/m.20471 type:complete len:197 (+) Transcript_10544:3-593(+)
MDKGDIDEKVGRHSVSPSEGSCRCVDSEHSDQQVHKKGGQGKRRHWSFGLQVLFDHRGMRLFRGRCESSCAWEGKQQDRRVGLRLRLWSWLLLAIAWGVPVLSGLLVYHWSIGEMRRWGLFSEATEIPKSVLGFGVPNHWGRSFVKTVGVLLGVQVFTLPAVWVAFGIAAGMKRMEPQRVFLVVAPAFLVTTQLFG